MTDTETPLICSECGEGNYWLIPSSFTNDVFMCDECRKTIGAWDFDLDSGERLSLPVGAPLSVVTPA